MKKDKYSVSADDKVLKYLQESRKRIFLTAGLLGAFLTLVPMVAMAGTNPHPSLYGTVPTWKFAKFGYTSSEFGKTVSVLSTNNDTLFWANSSTILAGAGTSYYNFAESCLTVVTQCGNDTFMLFGGNDTTQYVATAFGANAFNISAGSGNSQFGLLSGANSTFWILSGAGNSSFSMIGGSTSNFTIFQQNTLPNNNATQTFAITGGSGSNVTETNIGGPTMVYNTLYNINLGTESTVALNSDFQGNGTINVIF